jgi:predicted PurR-regulated permease PerM
MTENTNFNGRIIKAVFITLLMLSGLALIVFHLNYFLLVFAGIFFAIVLNSSSNWISKKLKTTYGLSLFIVLLLISGVLTGMILLIGSSISEQVKEMTETIPKSLGNLKEEIGKTDIGKKIFDEMPDNPEDIIADKGKAFSTITRFFSSTLGVFTDMMIIFMTGIFLAADHETYKEGFIRLFPVNFRQRLGEVLHKTHDAISRWMIAKLSSMLIVGIATAIGLYVLGIPLSLGLALIAALLCFIPNIGPFLGLVPALLVAFMDGTDKVLYVIILYSGIQLIETNLITPLIEKKMMALPAALSLVWMVLCGGFAGILGLLLATPILVALIVIVSELYVKDYLEGRNDLLIK